VGAQGQLTRSSNGPSPGTKYKRSKNVFNVTAITLSLRRLGTQLLGLAAQSLIGIPGTIFESWRVHGPTCTEHDKLSLFDD